MSAFDDAVAIVARHLLMKNMPNKTVDDLAFIKMCAFHMSVLVRVERRRLEQIVRTEFDVLTRMIDKVYVDISSSDGSHVVLIDSVSGRRVAIPVTELAQLYFKSG